MILLTALAVAFAGAAAASTFLVLRPDVSTQWAAFIAAVAALAVGVGWFYLLYLAPFALAAAIVMYLIARRRISTGHAFLAAAATFGGLIAVSAALMHATSSTM